MPIGQQRLRAGRDDLTLSMLAHDNDGHGHGSGQDADDTERLRPLEDRLRRMNWPRAPSEVRRRTLEELHRKLGELNGAFGNGSVPDAQDDAASEQPSHRREAR